MKPRTDAPPRQELDAPAPPPQPQRQALPLNLNLPSRDLLPEIDRLILNETHTRAGADFYNLFVQQWGEPERGGYTIVIGDKPARGRAINLWIQVNGTTLLDQTFLPSSEYLKSLATDATSFIVDYVEGGRHLFNE